MPDDEPVISALGFSGCFISCIAKTDCEFRAAYGEESFVELLAADATVLVSTFNSGPSTSIR